MNRSVRLRPTPTQNRPSCSWWTSSSSAWLVPSRCRQILSARHDSSVGRVVEVAAVAAPGGPAEHPGDLVVLETAGPQVLDPHREPLVAGRVGGVGQQVGVRADRGAAQGEELVALGQLVDVEQQLLAGQGGLVRDAVLVGLRGSPVVVAADRDPAGGAVLLALVGAGVVPEAAVARRHRQVGLAGAGLDLLEDGLPQVGEVADPLLGVGVLGLEVGRDVGVLLGPQPVVLVDAGAAVVGGRDRAARGDWWLHGRKASRGTRVA